MEPNAHLAALRSDIDAFVRAAGRGTQAIVPSCPGWTVGDLAVHLSVIQRRMEKNVRTASKEPVWPEPAWEVDPARPDLLDWFGEGAAQLLDTLERHGPDAPAWHWFPGGTARVVFRRVALETAIHRWDAERAHGDAGPIDDALAADGVDEILDAMLPVAVWAKGPPEGSAPTGERFAFRSPDGCVRRSITFAPDGIEQDDGGEPHLTFVASAPELFLFVWERLPADRLRLEGDPALVERWAALAPAV